MSGKCACRGSVCVLQPFACVRCREFRKLTYPARCFLDLSEMPSRDISLLNTTIPISIFTWERQRRDFDQESCNRWVANGDWICFSIFVFFNVSIDWRWLFNCPTDSRLKVTALLLSGPTGWLEFSSSQWCFTLSIHRFLLLTVLWLHWVWNSCLFLQNIYCIYCTLVKAFSRFTKASLSGLKEAFRVYIVDQTVLWLSKQ